MRAPRGAILREFFQKEAPRILRSGVERWGRSKPTPAGQRVVIDRLRGKAELPGRDHEHGTSVGWPRCNMHLHLYCWAEKGEAGSIFCYHWEKCDSK
jgi:hypothetical protein